MAINSIKYCICFTSFALLVALDADSQLLSASDEYAEVHLFCSGDTLDVYSYYEKRDSDKYYRFRFVDKELTSVYFADEKEFQILEVKSAHVEQFRIPELLITGFHDLNGFEVVDMNLAKPGPATSYKEGWVKVTTGTYEMNFTISFNDFSGDLLSVTQRIPTEKVRTANTYKEMYHDPHGLQLVFKKERQVSILRTYYHEKQSGVEVYVDRKGRIILMNIWSGKIIYQRLTKRTLRKLLKYGCN